MAIRLMRFSNPNELIQFTVSEDIARSRIKSVTKVDGLWTLSYTDDDDLVSEGETDVTNQEPVNKVLPVGDNYRIEWSVESGVLPAGVTLNPDGTVTGTPTTPGQTTVTLVGSPKIDLTWNVNPNNPTPDEFSLVAVDGDTVNAQLTASGGVQPFTWTLESGSLPTGLSLAANGAITGTVTEIGTFNPVFRVTGDDTGTSTVEGLITINAQPLVIDTATLPDATGQVAYSESLSASGGLAPYTWSATGLPAGLSMASNGTISGTPIESGNFSVTVSVTDSQPVTTPKVFSLDVVVTAIDVTTTSLDDARTGDAYSVQLAASGGIGSYSWAVTAGSLPTGLSLASDGTLSGTASVEETANFTVTVTDADGSTASQNLSIAVTTLPSASFNLDFTDPTTMSVVRTSQGANPTDGQNFFRIVDTVGGVVFATLDTSESAQYVAGEGSLQDGSFSVSNFQGTYDLRPFYRVGGVMVVECKNFDNLATWANVISARNPAAYFEQPPFIFRINTSGNPYIDVYPNVGSRLNPVVSTPQVAPASGIYRYGVWFNGSTMRTGLNGVLSPEYTLTGTPGDLTRSGSTSPASATEISIDKVQGFVRKVEVYVGSFPASVLSSLTQV